MLPEQLSRLESIQQHIESANYQEFNNSTQNIFDEIINLVAWKSFAGHMMVDSKRELNKLKVNAYHSLIASQRSVKLEIPPSIAKDYISAKCGDQQAEYDLAERVSANLAYYIDVLRTILSTLKQEMSTVHYGS